MKNRFQQSQCLNKSLLIGLLSCLILGFNLLPSQENSLSYNQEAEKKLITVTSNADHGEGTLRQALENIQKGTVIQFDPTVFPLSQPASIYIESSLPEITVNEITIDASNAGVILDGSLTGNDPERALLDDVTLSFDGNSNLIKNGDFNLNDQLDHWYFWQLSDVENFQWNAVEGAQSPGAFEWNGTSRHSFLFMSYQDRNQTTDTSGSEFSMTPETGYFTLDETQKIELVFWYRYGNIAANLEFLTADGQNLNEMHEFDYSNNWTQASFEINVPENVISVALEFYIFPSLNTQGLMIYSNHNSIQGLEIINFPGNGISIEDGSQNLIGSPSFQSQEGCTAGCNVLSGNMEAGVMINKGEKNIIQGNYIGVDRTGTTPNRNELAGIRIFDSSNNQIGGNYSQGEGNLISGNSMGIEINEEFEISEASHNIIQGNLIGTDFSGTQEIGNDSGISLGGASKTIIGAVDPDLRNIISGNAIGISISRNARENLIFGNYIGTDLDGLNKIANVYAGIELIDGASANQIGGIIPGEGNLISGNQQFGIILSHFETSQNTILGNLIGVASDQTSPIPNRDYGIFIYNAQNNQIGPGNIIKNNGLNGVFIDILDQTNGNTITQNSISDNGEKGIIVKDQSSGQVSPEQILVSSRTVGGNAQPGTTIEIYQDSNDEGNIFLGSIEVDDKGRFYWVAEAGTTLGENITTLTTDLNGTTGSFSTPIPVPTSFWVEIPGYASPEQISFTPRVVLLNLFIAIIAMIFFGLVSTWFNESLENSSIVISDSVKQRLNKLNLLRGDNKASNQSQTRVVTIIKWLLILSLTAGIQTLLDPDIRINLSWVGQLATIILSGILITGIQVASEWALRLLYKDIPDVTETEVSTIGLVMAGFSVLFSRVIHFSPGLVLGTVDGLYCTPELADQRQDGMRALAAKGIIFGVTFIGWLVSPKFHNSPGLQALLITMFVVGVQYTFFELIPLKVLDGHAVLKWNKLIWGLSFLVSIFGFIYLCINPDIGDLSAFQENSMLSLGIMAGILLLAAVVLKVFLQKVDHIDKLSESINNE
ncbi:MAG: right-handed parallel beta-helix repeat-containing protein [Anaerolineaceae bacterium]|nr:right-handed parallel beta-helix repeat-containing protein [Anaerolineaceae bacterium]